MLGTLLLSLIKAIPDTAKELIESELNETDDISDEFDKNDKFSIYDKICILEQMLERQEDKVKIKKIIYDNERNLFDKIPYCEQKNKQDKNTWMQQKKMLNAQIAYNKALDRRDKIRLCILELKEKSGFTDGHN